MATKLSTYIQDEASNALIPKVTHAIYNRTLLERALPLLLHQKFGQQRPLKRRNGTSMVFRRYMPPSKITNPLNEGDPGVSVDLTKQEVVATIQQYGNWTEITDMLDMAGFDDIINEAAAVLGENMGQSLDSIYREVLNSGTFWRGVVDDWKAANPSTTGSSRNLVAGTMNKYALDEAINILDRANAKKFTSLVQGQNKDNTFPVAASYWAIIHPDVERDLYNQAHSGLTVGQQFTPVEQYASQTQVMEGEIGKYRSIRFCVSTEAKRWLDAGAAAGSAYRAETDASVACDVYSTLIFGRDAYGIVPLDGGSTRTIIHRAGGQGDPLNQKNTVGWKAATTAVLLQDAHMVRIESLSLA